MRNVRRAVDLGLAAWALRGVLMAGKLTPMGAILLLPTVIGIARDATLLARDGKRIYDERRAARRVR